LVQAILDAFPQAEIVGFHDPEPQADIAEAALAAVEDEWDPFEEY
jgi:hypothetical protein